MVIGLRRKQKEEEHKTERKTNAIKPQEPTTLHVRNNKLRSLYGYTIKLCEDTVVTESELA